MNCWSVDSCREHIGDTRLLKRLDVWGALLGVGMPFTALTRSLGRLTSLGAFNPARCNSAEQHLAAVTARFSDANAMKVCSVSASMQVVFRISFSECIAAVHELLIAQRDEGSNQCSRCQSMPGMPGCRASPCVQRRPHFCKMQQRQY